MSSDFRDLSHELFDPNSLKPYKIDLNMYGLSSSFESLVKLDCKRIEEIINEPFLNVDNIDLLLGEHINFENDIDLNFIDTEEAKIRVAKILFAFKANIFILIIGSTSDGKTYSIYVAYNIFYLKQLKLGKNLDLRWPKRINFSEETSRDDFIGSIVYNDEKCQYEFRDGPFTQAYEKGYWLLIDELTLAPPQVLQTILAALDSKHLTVQRLGETIEIPMHEDFFLVCTTNPNNEFYERSDLPKDYLDRFLLIHFENLTNNEMSRILIEKCNGEVDESEIQKIINAHYLHTIDDNEKSVSNIFTLRDFDKARFLFSRNIPEKFNSEKIIDLIYRTRSGEDFVTYDSSGENPFEDNKDFKDTDSRKKFCKVMIDCLRNGFNLIVENDYNEGTLYFVEEVAKIYNKDSSPFIISMTDELHLSDLTEFSIPLRSNDGIKVKIVKAVIYKAMETGRVVIIKDLENGKTKVIEALNDIYECNLLDSKSIQINRGFAVNPNFRIIFIFHPNSTHNLSAAFFNRFIYIKMKPTGEISRYIKAKEELCINTFNTVLKDIPDDVNTEVDYFCNKKEIAATTQIKSFYALTKLSVEKKNTNLHSC